LEVIHSLESLRRGARYNPTREFKRSIKVIRAAHAATLPDGRPDFPTALKAADINLKLAGAYPKDSLSIDPGKPVAVNIILTGRSATSAGAELQSHGVRLHLSGHNGDSA
jgi:hypothetical protein